MRVGSLTPECTTVAARAIVDVNGREDQAGIELGLFGTGVDSMVRRLTLLIALTFVLGLLFAPPAHAATEVRHACVTRGPVSGDTVLVCARLFDDGFRSFYAYGGMDGSNAEPVLYIDALHLRYNLYGLEYVAVRAQAKSGRDYINQRTASVTFNDCNADVFAIIGYHIIWQNGQRTPASGQANVRTGTWPACG